MKLLKWYGSYLTNWILTIYTLYSFDILPKYMDYTVYLLTHFLCIAGPYIVYIHPRFIHVKTMNIILTGKQLRLLDFIFHILPFITFIINCKKIEKTSMFLFYYILIVYLFFNNPMKLYNVSPQHIANIIIIHFFSICINEYISTIFL